jgi:hypothetical protein
VAEDGGEGRDGADADERQIGPAHQVEDGADRRGRLEVGGRLGAVDDGRHRQLPGATAEAVGERAADLARMRRDLRRPDAADQRHHVDVGRARPAHRGGDRGGGVAVRDADHRARLGPFLDDAGDGAAQHVGGLGAAGARLDDDGEVDAVGGGEATLEGEVAQAGRRDLDLDEAEIHRRLQRAADGRFGDVESAGDLVLRKALIVTHLGDAQNRFVVSSMPGHDVSEA